MTTPLILRRNHRGCKSADFFKWPDQAFNEMESPLAVQQLIQQNVRKDPSNIEEILRLPEGQELAAWKYEHLRQICLELNKLINLFAETCDAKCEIMKTAEHLIFLCAFHKEPRECPAADYAAHTVDMASSLLNNYKYFPSRVTVKDTALNKAISVVRRIHRIFFHGYLDHFKEFNELEKSTHLCRRFVRLVLQYDLADDEAILIKFDGDNLIEPNNTLIQNIKVQSQESSLSMKEKSSKEAKSPDKAAVDRCNSNASTSASVSSSSNNSLSKEKPKPKEKPSFLEKKSLDSSTTDAKDSSSNLPETEFTSTPIEYSTSTLRRNKALSMLKTSASSTPPSTAHTTSTTTVKLDSPDNCDKNKVDVKVQPTQRVKLDAKK